MTARPIASARVWSLWQRHLAALGALTAAILLLFARDAADMAGIWWHS